MRKLLDLLDDTDDDADDTKSAVSVLVLDRNDFHEIWVVWKYELLRIIHQFVVRLYELISVVVFRMWNSLLLWGGTVYHDRL